MQAIEIEAMRQIEVIEGGGEIIQETRLFDPKLGETRSMRSKEMAHDYRYFPDPDLLPLVFDEAFVAEIEKTLPELPDEKKARFMREYGLSAYDAGVLVAEQEKAEFYERVAKGRDGKMAANWVITNLFGALNKLGVDVSESPVTAENLGKLIGLIGDDTISGRIAKDVFEIMIETGKDPEAIVEEKGLKQITDTGAIETAIDEVIAANPDKVEEIRAGKDRMLGWFVGQVMKSTGGKANPGMVNKMLRDKILG
jgi:aspartyl-tRNA(Asn)/glutamyl-tRNA(Gln) amidotransferase subunit B